MSQRTERVDELLRQEIGEIVAREIADPRVGFATITEVETTPDLRHAKVWVSVIGQQAERDATIAALRRAVPFVRHELGGRLRLRRIPDLHIQLEAESLPTPVARVRRPGDTSDEPPSAVRGLEPAARRRRARPGTSTGNKPRQPRKRSR
jgi:ribosome-binding factor A